MTMWFRRFTPLAVGLGLCASFVSTTAAQEAQPPRHEADPPENLINVSWGDQIMVARGDAQLDTPEKIRRSARLWLDRYDGRTLLWRGSAYVIRRFYERRPDTGSAFVRDYYNKVAEVEAQFDPVAVAREAATANGQEMLIYLTIFDHGGPTDVLYGGKSPFPWQDRFTQTNPHVQAVDLEGKYHWGVLEMAYPEARKLMVDRIKGFVEEFDTDGVYVCTRSHSLPALHADQFGFGEPVVEAMRQRHGVDILTDPRFDYTHPDYAPTDPQVEAWRRLRGEYLVQFYRELREALPGKTIYTGIPRGRYLGPPYGNLYLDWETLVEEGLVDGLVLGVYSNAGLHPPLYVPHDQIGYLASEDDDIGIPTVEASINEIYGPLCREHGVKLFFNSGSYGPQDRRRYDALTDLNGYMLVSPSGASGRGVVAHHEDLSFPGGQMTIEARLFINGELRDHEGGPRILSKYGHNDGDRNRGWEWVLLPSGQLQFRVNQHVPGEAGSGGDMFLLSKRTLPVGRWFHVATVYDQAKGEMRVYIDGQLDNQRAIPRLPIRLNAAQDLYVGRYGGLDTNHFDGRIDELRLVARALTFEGVPSEPYTGREPGTVALYHFDQVGPDYQVGNAADPTRLPMAILGGGDDLLVDSADGLGRGLNMGLSDE